MAENVLIPQSAPDLAPLRESHEASDLEAEFKAMFIALFDEFIRPGLQEVSTVGVPHLGPFEQLERAVKNDGLALMRSADEDAMRFLYKAWKSRNPKRGLHMLRLYLRMLWPQGWSVEQLWCPVTGVYPADCTPDEPPEGFLTSRVRVTISSDVSSGEELAAVAPALRSVLPARMVIELRVNYRMDVEIGVSAGIYRGAAIQSFTANCI